VFRVVICHFVCRTKDKYVLSNYLGFVRKATSLKRRKGVRSHFLCSGGLTTTALFLLGPDYMSRACPVSRDDVGLPGSRHVC